MKGGRAQTLDSGNVDLGLAGTTICVPAVQPRMNHTEETVKYLCLIYDAESVLNAMPKAETEKFLGEYMAFGNELRAQGQLVGGNRLRPVQDATTVRIRNGKVSATDGPFAETKEQLGGYYLVEARDLNEAIQIASRIPSARTGSIEVRPVWEMAPPA